MTNEPISHSDFLALLDAALPFPASVNKHALFAQASRGYLRVRPQLIPDAVYFEISFAEVATTKETEPGIIGDYDAEGHLVGIEVLCVSKRSSPLLDMVA